MSRVTAWRPGTRRPLYRLDRVKHISSADLSFTGGRRLAVIAGTKGFVVWNAADGRLVFDGRTLDEPPGPVYLTEEVAVSSDGGSARCTGTPKP
jgi:hypothetical protein